MNFEWAIDAMKVLPEYGNYKGVVSQIFWRRYIKDENNVATDISGTVTLSLSNLNNFIPLENLEKSDIINWIESTLGATSKAQIDEDLVKKLQEKINLPVILLTITSINEEPANA